MAAMSEAVQIRVHRARSWLRKAGQAGKNGDLDSQFMFLWISFNALYGTPRYQDNASTGEIADFKAFLCVVERLSGRRVEDALRPVEAHIAAILGSPFLNIDCWRKWDKDGVRDREARITNSCHVYRNEPRAVRTFRQLYTLRNQLLHGAATDAGRRNRESLQHAIPILEACLPVFIDLASAWGDSIPALGSLPYAPSIGNSGRFNAPRVT